MTLFEIRKFKPHMWSFLGLIIGMISTFRGFPTGVIFAVSILGALVILPKRNPLVFWPIGLFVALLVFYVGYFLLWYTETSGLTQSSSSLVTSLALISLTVFSSYRRARIHSTTSFERTITPTGAIFLTALTGFVLVVGLRNYYIHPEAVIGNYLAGGDHGLHVEFIADLLKGSKNLYYSSPFSLQEYSKGIHFFLANLLLINTKSSTDPVLIQEHLVPALFEYFQLAAFAHLGILAALRMRVRQQTVQILLISIALFGFISIPKLINHLFWSGFTTSLTLSWILLIPITFPWEDFKLSRKYSLIFWPVLWWVIYTIGIWIVYQPYVVVSSAIGAAVFFRSLLLALIRRESTFAWRMNRSILIAVSTAIVVTVGVAPLFVQGKDSESLRRLVLFGVSWKISFSLVLASLILSVVVCVITQIGKRSTSVLDNAAIDLSMVLGIGAFTAVMMSLAAYVSTDFTLKSQPYYVQKMYWVSFFVNSVVLLKWTVVLFGQVALRIRQKYFIALQILFLIPLFLLPTLWNSSPKAALDRISIDWFARDMFVDMRDITPFRASVFNTWENLGAHVGNIALRRSSSAILPIDIAQSQNSILACWYMRQVNTNIVFTASGQSLELIKAGCDQFANYVESGVRVGPLILATPGMVFDKTVRLSSETRGPRFLATGFYEPEKWGTWADGFNSSLQMRPSQTIEGARIKFEIRRNLSISNPVYVEVFVNGKKQNSVQITGQSIKIELPALQQNDVLSFQFVCQRTYDEVLAISNDRNLQKCIGVKTFQITEVVR